MQIVKTCAESQFAWMWPVVALTREFGDLPIHIVHGRNSALDLLEPMVGRPFVRHQIIPKVSGLTSLVHEGIQISLG